MGEYADIAIDQGLAEYDNYEDDDDCDDGNLSSPRRRTRKFEFECVDIIQRTGETEKAFKMIVKTKNGKEFESWFPKSQISVQEKTGFICLPVWLLDLKLQ